MTQSIEADGKVLSFSVASPRRILLRGMGMGTTGSPTPTAG
jgi:hypothetical protein